ncbi:MAG: rolling circle replication-associated protein [Minisyncoccia bacterium]
MIYYSNLRISDFVTLKKYKDNLYKLTYFKLPVRQSGFEIEEKIKTRCKVNDIKLDNNLIRSKSKVFELAVCNDFEYFITCTINKEKYNRYDLKTYYKDFTQFLRDYNKKYKTKIQYLFIPERHKNGAWHIHGLIKGICPEHLIINEHGYLDWIYYRDRFGFISLSKVKDIERVSKYITKYITKRIDDTINDLNLHIYYASKGLKTAKEIKRGTLLSDSIPDFKYDFENDYVKIKWLKDDSIINCIL